MSFCHRGEFTTRPTLEGTFGMVASTHWIATACAQSVLERGGNAFDAATAGAFVLHVVEPHLNGPAGDMTGIMATANRPETPQVIMGQGPAPAGASAESYRLLGLDAVPAAGALAAAIPGAVDAWLMLLQDHGSWELGAVLEYAIGYAAQGYPAVERIGATVAGVSELFTKHWPSSAHFWMPGGRPPHAGEMLKNPAYAQTLQDLLSAGEAASTEKNEQGRRARIQAARIRWKTGPVAHSLEQAAATAHRHSDGRNHSGVLTAADMAGFQAAYDEPVSLEFRGYTISKTGFWGQGPVLLQALAILEGYPDAELDPGTEAGAHRILEALKLALADRDSYYGDSDQDLSYLLSAEYAQQRRELIGETASAEFRPGRIPGGTRVDPPLVMVGQDVSAPGVGEPTVDSAGNTRGDTCHIDVVDRWGNIITATPSGGWLQSSPFVPEVGFPLGTRLQMMWLDDDSPAALAPGRRPRTTLSPTLVSWQGAPILALGTPGGDQQDQWQLLFLLRYLLGGHSLQQAIDAPAFHTTSMISSFWPREFTPAGVVVESRVGSEFIEQLRARGHQLSIAGGWTLGRISCVGQDPKSGRLQAGANPRQAQGYAAGR